MDANATLIDAAGAAAWRYALKRYQFRASVSAFSVEGLQRAAVDGPRPALRSDGSNPFDEDAGRGKIL